MSHTLHMKRVLASAPIELLGADFDNTIAKTAADVEDAYRRATIRVFGVVGARLFEHIGGLENRSPYEFVVALRRAFNREPERLEERARNYLEDEFPSLEACVPHGKGRKLMVDDPEPVEMMLEILVREKLRYLLPQISREWPEIEPGFVALYKLCRVRNIDFAVISAGHELFIGRFFEAHEKPVPRLFTDDDLRGTKWQGVHKPDPRLMDRFFELHYPGAAEKRRQRMLYIGDDLRRDGLLAKKSGVRFGWYNPGEQGVSPEFMTLFLEGSAFEFRHHYELYEALLAQPANRSLAA